MTRLTAGKVERCTIVDTISRYTLTLSHEYISDALDFQLGYVRYGRPVARHTDVHSIFEVRFMFT